MAEYSLAHLSDADLVRDILALVTRDRVGSAVLLAHLAEFDARRLFLPAGYPSMFVYCVEHLNFSESGAGKRIHAARAARRFPVLYPALASGRLHLTAVCLLAPHLTDDNATELIEAATYRRRTQIEGVLARRFPQTLPRVGGTAVIRIVAAPAPDPGRGFLASVPLFEAVDSGFTSGLATAPADATEPRQSTATDTASHISVPPRHKEHPLEDVKTSEHFLIRLTVTRATHDKLREAQAMLSHSVAPGDLAELLDRALDQLLVHLKKKKLGSTRNDSAARPGSPRGSGRPRHRSRYIPAAIRRAIWERDGGRCTFVSDEGRRCAERDLLEFDHVTPLARGGTTTVANLRLRCRAHNQYEAERAFGVAFIRRKRGDPG